jgi:hypothetical protein
VEPTGGGLPPCIKRRGGFAGHTHLKPYLNNPPLCPPPEQECSPHRILRRPACRNK